MRTLEILDADLYTKGYINTYKSLVWTERYYEAGDFELEVPDTDYNREILTLDSRIICSESERFMVIEKIGEINDGDTKMLKISGNSGEYLLHRRIVWKQQDFSSGITPISAIQSLIRNNAIWPEYFSTYTYRRQMNGLRYHGFKDIYRNSYSDYVLGADYSWSEYNDSGRRSYICWHIPVTSSSMFWIVNTAPQSAEYYDVHEYNSSKTWLRETKKQSAVNESFSWWYKPSASDVAYISIEIPRSHSDTACVCNVGTDSNGNEHRMAVANLGNISYFGDNLYDVVSDISKNAEIGMKMRIKTDSDNNRYITFESYPGWDRTFHNGHRNPVIFSTVFNNITSSEHYRELTPFYTAVLVAGAEPDEESGKSRWYVGLRNSVVDTTRMNYHTRAGGTYSGSSGAYDGYARHELFIDGSSKSLTYGKVLSTSIVNSIRNYLNNDKSTNEIAILMGTTGGFTWWEYSDDSKSSSKEKVATSRASSAINRIENGETDENGDYYFETDYTETEYKNILRNYGKEQYKQLTGWTATSVEISDTKTFEYQKDYWVGDQVTFMDEHGNEYEGRITEFIYSCDTNGEKMYPTIEWDPDEMVDELTNTD